MPKKYTFAIRLNCSHNDFGSQVNMLYLVVEIMLLWPLLFRISEDTDRHDQSNEDHERTPLAGRTVVDTDVGDPGLVVVVPDVRVRFGSRH